MKKKIVKKLRKMADTIGFNKTAIEREKIYKRLKNIHKSNAQEKRKA